MTEDDLRRLAQEKGVRIVDDLPLPETESLIIEEDGYTIGLDKSLTGANKKAHLAHEMGHAMKGAVYRAASPLRTRSRCEYRANKWAYEHILPLQKLESADITAPLCEIAEELDVPESFLRGAIRYYMAKGDLFQALPLRSAPVQDRELSALRLHVIGRRELA